MTTLQTRLLGLKEAAEVMPDSTNEVLSLLKQGRPYTLLFFREIKDPKWLPLLKSWGCFSVNDSKSEDSDLHRLAFLGLARLAERAPNEVTELLLAIDAPSDPALHDLILQCIAAIPQLDCIRKLRHLAIELAADSRFISGIWIVELCKKWMAVSAQVEALDIAEAYLLKAARLRLERPNSSDTWIVKQLDEAVLSRMGPVDPLRVILVCYQTLVAWGEHEAEPYAESFQKHGPYSYWLESFHTAPEYFRELEATLAVRLYCTGREIYEGKDPSKIAAFDKVLNLNSWRLFERLRWQLYADFPETTLAQAKIEVLRRMACFNRYDHMHDFEFGQLLANHSSRYGHAFLSREEIATFVHVVTTGPVDETGTSIEEDQKSHFQFKQLWPIANLLKTTHPEVYQRFFANSTGLLLDTYKPFRAGKSGFVELVPPPRANDLASMNPEELWTFLNTWTPRHRDFSEEKWIQEDAGALATKFAELIDQFPDRFSPSTHWWWNIQKQELLSGILDRATDRISAGKLRTEATSTNLSSWRNYFGIAHDIVFSTAYDENGKNAEPIPMYARKSVARFLEAIYRSESVLPSECTSSVSALLISLISKPDSSLSADRGTGHTDWLSVAINSTRGQSLQALLHLALNQKKQAGGVESWIFELFKSCVEERNASPAIFALIGANLRLLAYVFADEFRRRPDLVFPDRPECANAAIITHFCYDSPMTRVIETFPRIIAAGIESLRSLQRETTGQRESTSNRDFAAQLGIHIAFYYWNDVQEQAEALLEEFFSIAPIHSRSVVIGQIASIFNKVVIASAADERRINRVMQICERRLSKIEAAVALSPNAIEHFGKELAEFTDWLDCECFPFEWRVDKTMRAISLLEKSPESFQLLRTIVEISKQPQRQAAALKLLNMLLEKPSDELRWSIDPQELRSVIEHGCASEQWQIRELADAARDKLLNLGHFQFLS